MFSNTFLIHYGNLDLRPGTSKTRNKHEGPEFIGQHPEEIQI
eukprot:UN18651